MKMKHLVLSMLIIFGTILLGIVVCVCLFIEYITVALNKNINAEVAYGGITYNDDYIGYYEGSFKLSIVGRKSGKLIKQIDLPEPDYAVRFALGNEGVYVLYLNNEEDFAPSPEGECKIIRYPYNEGLTTEYSMDNIYDISCMDEKLYLACGKELADVNLHNYVNGFDANMYVEESEFGNIEPKKISPENSQNLYEHNSLYYATEYATEPDIGGYEGRISGNFSIENISLQTDKEKEIHALLVDRLDKYVNAELMYYKFEYQSGEMIYGICNQFERWRPRRPDNLSASSVEKSYLYSIDAKTMQISVKTFDDNRMLLIASKDYYLYQLEGKVIKENIKSGESEILYQFNSLDYAEIDISGDVILIVDKTNIDASGNAILFASEKKYLPIIWN